MDETGQKGTVQDNSSSLSGWPSPIQRVVTSIRKRLGGTKVGVHILVCVFAISAWANLNGIWSELSLLVPKAPEGWDLPADIIIVSELANIGPLLFVLVTVFAPYTKPRLEKYTSLGIIMSGVFACLMLAFFWKHTSYIDGKEHSTALLALEFIFALGDCTSSVSFYAFMSSLKPEYMASLFLGEGFSGMLPAFIALGQGVGDVTCVNKSKTINATYPNGTEYNKTVYSISPVFGKAHFSVQVYFIIIAVILAISAGAFLLLNTLDYCKSEVVNSEYDDLNAIISNASIDNDATSETFASPFQNNVAKDNRNLRLKLKELLKIPEMSGSHFIIYMVIIIIINMTRTTFLATIQNYSTLPYGLEPYHLATNLAQITNPLACFFALLVMTSNLPIIAAIFTLGEVGVAVIIYIAAKSPDPPLYDKDSGDFLIVFLWVTMTFLLTYVKVCVAGVMRRSGRGALIWTGVITQAGAFIGAIVGFLLVSKYKLFHSAPYCRG